MKVRCNIMRVCKWYSFYTNSPYVKNDLRDYLQYIDAYYETSACGFGWHFTIKCDIDQMKLINNKLDELHALYGIS